MRPLRYIILIIAATFWAAGLSSTVSHWLYDAGVIVDDYRNGDLYRLSALPQFREPKPVCPRSNRDVDTSQTHLYIIGDSFTEPERITQDDFRVSYFRWTHWDTYHRVQLDTTKRNVLLLETIERHTRDHFSRPTVELTVVRDTVRNPAPRPSFFERLAADLHWDDVEERLSSVLFSHDWAFWCKEIKAKLTFDLFDRTTNTGVSLSENRQHIFLGSDTDTSTPLSSFSELTDAEVNRMVDSLNAISDRYKRAGFREVYLNIIPNKVTMLEPQRGTYNHLIERIQNHPALRVPVIDTYGTYRRLPRPPYLKSDTHWDCSGRAIWLKQVREKLGV